LTTVEDPLGHVVTTYYDELNRPYMVIDPLGNVNLTSYDAVSNAVSITDANGQTTNYAYNERNQLVSVTDALGGIVIYAYDAAGNRVSVTDANGHTTVYSYDQLNRLISQTNPLSIVQSQTYDENGNLATMTDGNGNTSTFTYDDLNRLISIAYADGSQVHYTYDSVGNRLTMIDSTGTTSYGYDDLYRPVTITSSIGTLNYSYDATNQLTITSPAGTVAYSYDMANRLIEVEDWDSRITTYAYDGAGRLSDVTSPNAVQSSISYDDANRILDITYRYGASLIEDISYTYDAVGNRLSMTDADGTTTYTYDELNRLKTVTYPLSLPAVVSYTYDPMGNRLTMDKDAVITSYVYNNADQLVSKTTSGVTTYYTWDNAGNLITKNGYSLTWNDAGKLTSWTNGVDNITFTYNGDGDRVEYNVNGIQTEYLQDISAANAVVIQEISGTTTIDYVYGLDLISQIESSNTLYIHSDGLGSTKLLSDPSATIVARYAYDVFGEIRSYIGTENTNYTFTGEQLDVETGLQFLRARYYDPDDGRFISVDPVPGNSKSPQTLNPYVYVENRPVNLIDPAGTSSQEASQAVLGNSTHTSSMNEGVEWEYPWYFNLLDDYLSLSKLKIEGETFLDFAKIGQLSDQDFEKLDPQTDWKIFKFARKGFGYVKDFLKIFLASNRYKHNQATGVYGKSEEARALNLGQKVTIMRAWEVGSSWIPSKHFMTGTQMKRQSPFSGFADRYSRRQGALVDMAVIDPSKDPNAFLDALDRYNGAFK
jgi:RHS repeat-associated protein